jgi:hypothetical protein
MKFLVDKIPEIKEDCILYKGKEIYMQAWSIDMENQITLYTHYCIDGKECDLSCGKCSRLKVLE